MDLSIIPFGNAMIEDVDQHVIECQHGKAECDANIWEECAVDLYPPTIYMDFLACLEDALPMHYRDEIFDESIFENCTTTTTTTSKAGTESTCGGGLREKKMNHEMEDDGIDFAKLKACHDDPTTAWAMQMKYAKLTPDNHEYVPWVLVDYQLVDVEKEDFFQRVCRSYLSKGGIHPACVSTMEEEDDEQEREE